MKNLDRLENFSRSKVATLCAGSVYPLTGGNDSSADYWRLRVVKDAQGNNTGFSVDWDGSLALTMENENGSTTVIDESNIANNAAVQQWFSQNDIGNLWNSGLQQQFNALGLVSLNSSQLRDAVKNQNGVAPLINNYLNAVNGLLNSGLAINGLQAMPDQNANYTPMLGNVARTTLFGNRIITEKLASVKVPGVLYNWGTNNHTAEDYSGGTGEFVTPMASNLNLSWSDSYGLQLGLTFESGDTLQFNHSGSSSVMNILESMLISNSITNLGAGLHFGTMGDTGKSAGVHTHLIANNGAIAPSELFQQLGINQGYYNDGTELTGYPNDTQYNNEQVIKDVLTYSETNNGFGAGYVNAHSQSFQSYWSNGIYWVFDPQKMVYKPASFSSNHLRNQ